MPTRDQRRTGRLLRYELSLVLHQARQPMTVPQLIAALEASGRSVPGRASKTVSDALRQEIRRGRVRRRGRATYETARIPESTLRWMLRQLALARAAPPPDLAAS